MKNTYRWAAAAAIAVVVTISGFGCQAQNAAEVKAAYTEQIDRLAQVKAAAVSGAAEIEALIVDYEAQLAALPPGDPSAATVADVLAQAREALAVVRDRESQADEAIDRFRAAIAAIDNDASVASANLQAGIAAGQAGVPFLPPPWNIIGGLVLAVAGTVAGKFAMKRPNDVSPETARERENKAWDEAYAAGIAAAKGGGA